MVSWLPISSHFQEENMSDIDPRKLNSLPVVLLMGAAMLAPAAYGSKSASIAPKPAAPPA